jgi:hypothetical protein
VVLTVRKGVAFGNMLGDAFGDEAENFVDGERAGDFAGRGSAHAVTHDIDSMLDGVAKGVFIGGALAAAIGKGGGGVAHDSGSHVVLPAPKFTTRLQDLAGASDTDVGTDEDWAPGSPEWLGDSGRIVAGGLVDHEGGLRKMVSGREPPFQIELSFSRGW